MGKILLQGEDGGHGSKAEFETPTLEMSTQDAQDEGQSEPGMLEQDSDALR